MRRPAVLAVVIVLLGMFACTNDSPTTPSSPTTSTFAMQMASSDLYAGTPQRVQLGVFNQTADGIQLLTGGSIPLSLAPADGGKTMEGTARYLPPPGNPGGGEPALASPA